MTPADFIVSFSSVRFLNLLKASRLVTITNLVFLKIVLSLLISVCFQKSIITGIILQFISFVVLQIVKNLLTSISREALQDDYKIEELKEGMIPAYSVYENDKKVFIDDKSFYSRLKEGIKSGDISIINPPRGKLIVSSMAAGLTDKDIKLLKELNSNGKLLEKFRIKRGVPFAPSILIGLLISLFVGDIAFIIDKILIGILY